MMASRILFAAALLIPSMSAALADDGCGKFAWPLARERAQLTAPDRLAAKPGDRLSSFPDRAIVFTLLPNEQAGLDRPPERKPKTEHWFGGALRLPAPQKAGIYQVALSDEAWIDVVQDGRYAHSTGFSGRNDCPGLRKSVRFELAASPVVLQISGAAAPSIAITIGAAD